MSANTPAQFPIEFWGLFKSVLFVPPLVNRFAPRPVPQNPFPQPMSLIFKLYIPKPLKPHIVKPKQQVECKLCGYHCAAQNLEAHERCMAALVTGSGLQISHGLELGCRSTQQQKSSTVLSRGDNSRPCGLHALRTFGGQLLQFLI